MNICWLDIVIALPLLIGLVRGIMRGLVSELTAIAAVLLGYLGTRMWGKAFSAWMIGQFAWPEPVCNIVAYSLLFLGITLALNVVGSLLSKLLKAIHLGWLNRLLGAVFGTAKWAVVILILVYLVGQMDAQWHLIPQTLHSQSVLYDPALQLANQILAL
ncbi:MAG: CvpA family protein [Paludibacteraceae bacterium]|nr:CvpA family protein [Paludibacteraceae bacterium]